MPSFSDDWNVRFPSEECQNGICAGIFVFIAASIHMCHMCVLYIYYMNSLFVLLLRGNSHEGIVYYNIRHEINNQPKDTN